MTSPADPTSMQATLFSAAARLLEGGVVAFPTETVYGLGALASNPNAVARVFALKGRPSSNPLIVHVTGPDMARTVATEWPDWADRLARAFWPGPLTLILPATDSVRGVVTAGGPTVAVRAPAHPAAMALLYAVGQPLVGPSANRSGRVSPTTAEHVRDSFSAEDVLVLDGGACSTGIESTVVRFSNNRLEILRPGVIGPSAIAAALALEPGRVALGPAHHEATEASLPSPGLLAEHYAPVAPAFLFDRSQWPLVVTRAAGGPIALLSFGDMSAADAATIVAMPSSASEYAAALYASLRHADATRPALIAIEAPPQPGSHCGGEAELWHAIGNRLQRAARRLD